MAGKQTIRLAVLFAAAAALAVTGCSVLSEGGGGRSLYDLANGEDDTTKRIKIQYDSEPARLNLLAAQSAGPDLGVLPAADTCRLTIVYPHPHGTPDKALASVALLPAGFGDGGSPSLWERVTGDDDEPAPGANRPLRTWQMEIPSYQVDAIVTKLRKDNFFRRARPLSPEIYLAVQIDDVGFGKDYRKVDELDAIILQVQRGGQAPIHGVQNPTPISQGVGQGPIPTSPRAAMMNDGRVHRLPPIY